METLRIDNELITKFLSIGLKIANCQLNKIYNPILVKEKVLIERKYDVDILVCVLDEKITVSVQGKGGF